MDVWIQDDADWPAFYTNHVLPFISAHCQAALVGEIERLANAVIAFARHGSGEHVDRFDGKSHIDLERARRARMR